MAFRIGHDRAIRNPEIEVGIASVEFGRSTKEGRRQESDSVLSLDHGFQKEPRGSRSDARAEQVIRLDDHGIEHDEIPAQFGHEGGGKTVRLVSRVCRGKDRPGVGDNPQRTVTGPRR